MSLSNNVQKTCFWLGDPALFVWLYQPTVSPSEKGIVLCPPLGHEYVHTHRSYRYLAEQLAAAGVTVLRPDLYGTGDSSGSMLDSEVMENWQQDINLWLDYLQQIPGIQTMGLFGIRMGATLAMLAAAERPLDFIVLWNPIVQGKRYLRELQAVNRLSAKKQSTSHFFEAAGFPVSSQLAQNLEQLTLPPLAFSPSQVAIIGEPADNVRALFAGRSKVMSIRETGYAEMMAEPQFTKVPRSVFDELTAWVQAIPPPTRANTANHPSHHQFKLTAQLEGSGYKETFTWLGHCFAIVCSPVTEPRSVLVLANSGSVHHVGPNRLYTLVSRALAAEGIVVVRMDLSNLGDSVAADHPQENTTYPDSAVLDAQSALTAVKSHYPGVPLILGGICSGAHAAFHTALVASTDLLDKVIIINPLSFYWQPGMSLEIPTQYEVNKEAKHYQRSFYSVESWKKLLTGKVDYGYLFRFAIKFLLKKLTVTSVQSLEIIGLRKKSRLATDIGQLLAKPLAVTFIFSGNDPGYGILMEEGGVTVSRWLRQGRFAVHTIDGADHTFSRHAYRERLMEVLRTEAAYASK